MRRYSFFLLILCLLAACGDDARIATVLNRADSLMCSRPDSALSLLYNIESSVTGQSKSLCMRFQLLRHKAMNKVCVPFTSDSIMKEVTDYYNNHGTANEQVEANYLLGCVYRDLGETPHAIDCYRDAIAKADTTLVNCDYRTLSSVYSQLAWLFHKQLLFVNEADAHKQSGRYAQLAKDTLFVIYEMQMYAGAFISMNQKDSAEKVLTDVMRLYWDSGYKQEAIKVSTMLMYVYSEQPEHLSDLKRLIDVYEAECDLFDENHELPPSKRQYYYYKGMYFQGIHQLDSAEYYFRKIHRKKMAFTSQAIMYKGLLGVFQKRRQSDSIAKYSQLYCMATDSSVAVKDQQQTALLSASYDYNYYKNLSLKNENKALWRLIAFCMLLAVSIVVVFFVFMAYKRFKKAQEEKRIRLQEEHKKKEALLTSVHRQAVSQIHHELDDANKENISMRKQLAESKDAISQKQAQEKELSEKLESLTSQLESLQHTSNTSEQMAISANYADTEIIRRIKDLHADVRGKMTANDIKELIKATSLFYPAFIDDLNAMTNIDYEKMCVCILTGLNIKPGEINRLLNQSSSTTGNQKKELNTALFGEATAISLHENITRKYGIYQCFETKKVSKTKK